MEYQFFSFKYNYEIFTEDDEYLFFDRVGLLLHQLYQDCNNTIDFIVSDIDVNGYFTIKIDTNDADYINKFDDDDFEIFTKTF